MSTELKSRVADEPINLISITPDLNLFRGGYNAGAELLIGGLRSELKDHFDPDAWYNLLSTVANPAAVDLIKENARELSIARYGRDDEDFQVKFDEPLRRVYVSALNKLLEKKGIKHFSYPSVTISTPSFLPPVPPVLIESFITKVSFEESVSWPYVHVVQGFSQHVDAFKEFVASLNEDEVYALLTGNQAPYSMLEINLLRERKINPLQLTGNQWSCKGKDLKKIVDFLCQFEIRC